MLKKSKFYWLSLFLIVLLVPYCIGMMIEHHYPKSLALIANQLNIGLKPIEFYRSWFYSDVTLAANFPLADKPLEANHLDKNNALIIKQRIYHGPIIIYKNTSHTNLQFAIAHIDSFLDPKLLFAQSTVAFDKSVRTVFDLDKFNLMRRGSTLYSFTGLKGELNVSAGEQLVANIKLNSLTANLNSKRQIRNFAMKYELKSNSGLWTGKKLYHFEQLAWQQEDKHCFLQNTTLSILSHTIGNLAKVELDSNVQSAVVNNINYGPQHLAISLVGLDTDELKKLQRAFPNTLPSFEENNTFQQQLRKLFNKGATITLDECKLNTAWGQVDLKGNILCLPQSNLEFASIISGANGELKGKLPLEIASRLLTNYYLLQANTIDTAYAQQTADDSILDWQKSGWLTILGPDVLMDIIWQKKHLTSINQLNTLN